MGLCIYCKLVGGTDFKGIVKIGQYEVLYFWIHYAHVSTTKVTDGKSYGPYKMTTSYIK
jgi:hypothetical protein